MIRPLRDNTIQVRQLLSGPKRTRDAIVTSLLWVLYAYLWLPLISFLAWLVGIDFAYERVIKAGGPDELILLLLWFLIAFLVVLLIVVLWSGFQYSRHHGDKERRSRAVGLDPDDERMFWGIEQQLQDRIRAGKVLTVSLTDTGSVAAVREGSPADPASTED